MKSVFVDREIRMCDLESGEFSQKDLCYTMCRFINEVKKLNNSDFPPNSLREIVIMIQMFLNEKGIYWKLLDGEVFHDLRNTVDNLMKQRHAVGLGIRQSSNIITVADEEKLFASNVLGDSYLTRLLRTVIYL